MQRILVSAVALALAVTVTHPVSAQDLASQIVGVWKMTSWTRKEVETGKTTISPFGERPPGYAHFTRGGRVVAHFVTQDRKVNQQAELTDAESLDAFKTLVAYAGTYKVEGGNVVEQIEVAYVPSWAGTARRSQVVVAGAKLTLTSAPFKSRRDGKDIVVVTTWERIE